MNIEGRTAQLRSKFEAEYQDVLPHFRQIYPQIDRSNGYYSVEESRDIVMGLFETDRSLYKKLYRLAVPLNHRLNTEQKLQERTPYKPVRRTQVIKAIKEVNDEIRGVCHLEEFDMLHATVDESHEIPVRNDIFTRLEVQRQALIVKLPLKDQDYAQRTGAFAFGFPKNLTRS